VLALLRHVLALRLVQQLQAPQLVLQQLWLLKHGQHVYLQQLLQLTVGHLFNCLIRKKEGIFFIPSFLL
jgi:hypothetical protein